MLRFLSVAFSVLLLAIGAAAPSNAGAQTNGGLAVAGTVTPEGSFVGTASNLAFSLNGTSVVLSGQLVGVATLGDGTEVQVVQAFVAAVAVAEGTECGDLIVAVQAINVTDDEVNVEDTLSIQLDDLRLTSEQINTGGLLGGLLGDVTCEVTELLDPLNLDRLVDTLNEALERAFR